VLPADERTTRVEELAERERRVLVATDCLSEGINLQRGFDSVVHYDLAWNPTRHEQREGRVDRYGQPRPSVVVGTVYGSDNPIDGLVLEVLLRKNDRIRTALGFSVPVPVDSNAVLEAILEGILLRKPKDAEATQQLVFFEDLVKPKKDELHREWDRAAEAEKQSRSRFAQRTIDVDEVAREMRATRDAVGSSVDIRRFTADTLQRHGAAVRQNGVLDVDLQAAHRSFVEGTNIAATIGDKRRFKAKFEEPVDERTLLLARTHPIVEGLASWVIDTALDPLEDGVATRCGAVRTRAVSTRTTSLVVRIRYGLATAASRGEGIAEEARIVAFRGRADAPGWLPDDEAANLFLAAPSGNVVPEMQRQLVRQTLDALPALQPALERYAVERAEQLRESHDRVRTATRLSGKTRVAPRLPVDVLGVYVYLPHVTA
jgi:hypothetical protein